MHDSQRNLKLEAELDRRGYKSALENTTAELSSTNAELESMHIKANDAKWSLHEISNGAAHPAIKLYQAEERQRRASYSFRASVGQMVWHAEAAMMRDAATEFNDDE